MQKTHFQPIFLIFKIGYFEKKKDSERIALINGFEKEDILLKAGEKIKVLDNFLSSEEDNNE